MTLLSEEEGLRKQGQKVRAMVEDIKQRLQNPYGVPVPSLPLLWSEGTSSSPWRNAWVENSALYLNRQEMVVIPYYAAVRDMDVTLELGTSEGKKFLLTFPYGKILDLFRPTPQISFLSGPYQPGPLTDAAMKLAITEAIVAHVLTQVQGWLASDNSITRCIRNGITSSYGHLLAGTMPTGVSQRIWDTTDPGLKLWREADGGFPLLYPHLNEYFSYEEVITRLESAGPPAQEESLPEYIARVFQSL